MKKVSIAMYSTFIQPGWKSQRLEKLVPFLMSENIFEKGYGLKRFKQSNNINHLDLSFFPLICAELVYRFSKIFSLPKYLPYLVGEYTLGLKFYIKIYKDNSDIILLKPRPLSLINSAKLSGKLVVIEYGEMHPIHTFSVMMDAYKEFNIKSKYIYTSNFALKQSLKAIDTSDIIIVLSEESKKSFIDQGVDSSKIKVIPIGIKKRNVTGFDDGKPFAFISTAYHSFVKGTHQLLLAWKKAKIKDYPLIIVGPLQDDISEFIDKYGPFNNVKFVGHKNIDEFYNKYSAVGVLNSLSEGRPRSVLEYMQFGFPVIVSPVATCDLVKDGTNGFIIRDNEMLVEKLILFSKNIDLVKTMGNKALKTVNNLPFESYEQQMFNLLKEL